ncbi:hypothetical protein EDB83DRAFT_1753965 [Lactarius deliciosus]|nr:hypothetical protein EDB83DRAFT_1753965 [Lactarius deliciosus]
MPTSSALKREQSETLVGLNPVKPEYASGVNGQPFSLMTSLSTLPLSNELASHPKEEDQEHTHVFPTPAGTHGRQHHRPHANDSFRVQDDAVYLGHTSPPPSKRHPPPPSLAIPGQLAYSPGARNPTPVSSVVLVVRYRDASIERTRHERGKLVAGTTAGVGAEPQGRARRVEVAVNKAECNGANLRSPACSAVSGRSHAERRPWEALTRRATSVHGVHASVNTPQCRGVGSISVVIMGAATTRNPRTQITSLIHSRLRSSFPCFFLSFLILPFLLSFPMHAHAHIYPHPTNDSGFNVSIRSMYLDRFAFVIGRLYIMLASLVSRSGFPVCSLALICTSSVYCIYIVDTVLHEIRFSSHISTFLCIHSRTPFS